MTIAFKTIMAAGLSLLATPAFAQAAEPAAPIPITITGTAAIVSDYRLRGFSVSDRKPAVQASLTAAHGSGFYVGTWMSSLAGYGSFGGANLEVDLIVGYGTSIGKTALDGGLIYYVYPGTSVNYGEVYGSVKHPIGPVSTKLGVNYAWRQRDTLQKDNLYIYGEAGVPIKSTPLTLRATAGYTKGSDPYLAGPKGHYWVGSVNADIAFRNLVLTLSYVDTDIDRSDADALYTSPDNEAGHSVVNGGFVAALTASF